MALSLKQQLNNQTTELTNFDGIIAQLTIDDDNVKALADRVTTTGSVRI